MVPFDLWSESFIFASVYAVIIGVPCILVTLIGIKMINQLGHFPTKTPSIQMSIFIQLVIIEVITFAALIGFYRFFDAKM